MQVWRLKMEPSWDLRPVVADFFDESRIRIRILIRITVKSRYWPALKSTNTIFHTNVRLQLSKLHESI
jgi:hypothetical protein